MALVDSARVNGLPERAAPAPLHGLPVGVDGHLRQADPAGYRATGLHPDVHRACGPHGIRARYQAFIGLAYTGPEALLLHGPPHRAALALILRQHQGEHRQHRRGVHGHQYHVHRAHGAVLVQAPYQGL